MIVEGENSRPVGGGIIGRGAVTGGDAGFEVILANGIALCGEGEALDAALNHGLVLRGAVLLMEAEEIARIIGPGRESGGIQKHEGEQCRGARRLGGWVLGQEGDEADGFVAEGFAHQTFAATGLVAFVEKQIERSENAIEPLGQFAGIRYGKREPLIADELPGTNEPFCDGGFAGEKDRADLCGAQSAHRAQGECELRLGGDLRMKADEEHAQRVIGQELLVRRFVAGEPAFLRGGDLRFLALPGLFAAQSIQCEIFRRLREPGCRIVRNATIGPCLQCPLAKPWSAGRWCFLRCHKRWR